MTDETEADMARRTKLERLLRYHRQRVFDANGERHHRALLRLKATETARKAFASNASMAAYAASERLLRAYA